MMMRIQLALVVTLCAAVSQAHHKANSTTTINPMTTYGTVPPFLRSARIAAISKIHASEAGMRTFQPSRMSWS